MSASWELFGHGSATRIHAELAPAVASTADTLFIGANGTNSELIRFRDLTFVDFRGRPGASPIVSGRSLLHFVTGPFVSVVLDGVQVYGVDSQTDLIRLEGGMFTVENYGLYAVVARGGNALIKASAVTSLVIRNGRHNDYGICNGMGVAGTNAGYDIAIDAGVDRPSPLGVMTSWGYHLIENVQLDESPYFKIFAWPFSGNRGAHLVIRGVRISASSLTGAIPIYVSNWRKVTIEQGWIGYTSNPRTAVNLVNVGSARISQLWTETAHTSANVIRADGATKVLDVYESDYSAISSTAAVTLEHKAGRLKRSLAGGPWETIY
jgi:hypothetical protein